jgi:uncharacterized protein with PQ loop repeat
LLKTNNGFLFALQTGKAGFIKTRPTLSLDTAVKPRYDKRGGELFLDLWRSNKFGIMFLIMGKKNFILFWALLGIAVIIMATNDFQLEPGKVVEVIDSAAPTTLFVCPIPDADYDSIAAHLIQFRQPLGIVFAFFLMLWIAILSWAIYQAMLNDKVDKKSFEAPVFLGKFLLFLFILGVVFMRGPNNLRQVKVQGFAEPMVLCENDSPGAMPVKKDWISAKGFVALK